MILLRRTGFVAAGARRSCYRCYSSLSLLFLVFGATTPTGGAVPSGGSSESYYPRHCCGSIAAAVTGAGHSRRGATCFVGPATAPRRLSFSNKNISSEQRTRSSQLATSTGQMSSSTSLSASDRKLVVDPFCYRQFAEHEAHKEYGGTVFYLEMDEFERIVNERYDESLLKPGYADFCKHLFVKNDFTIAKTNVLKITNANEHLLRTRYEARNDKELPVLTRHFPLELVGADLPKADYLDLILYSRDQINKENVAQGRDANPATAPWGIVSIKAQNVDYELPMTPITAMRNALGRSEGGSGVPIDKAKYMEAVDYWKDHAVVS